MKSLLSKVLKSIGVMMIVSMMLATTIQFAFAENVILKASSALPVECDLGGIVSISAKDKTNPSPSKSSLAIPDKKKKQFEFEFDEPGTYHYTVSQDIISRAKNITYDESVYDVAFYVTAKGDRLISKTVIINKKTGRKVRELRFANALKKKKRSGGSNGGSNGNGFGWGNGSSDNRNNSKVQTNDTVIELLISLAACLVGFIAGVTIRGKNPKRIKK